MASYDVTWNDGQALGAGHGGAGARQQQQSKQQQQEGQHFLDHLLKQRADPGRADPGQELTRVPISAQLELTLPLSAQLKPTSSPI